MDHPTSTQAKETTALHLQSSHWLTDLLMGLGDGILLPSMWLLASWHTSLSTQQKLELAIGLVLLQSALHAMGIYVTSLKRDPAPIDQLTDTNNRKENSLQTTDVKTFLAGLDIPNSIQEQAWADTEAEKEKWNAQLSALQIGREKPQKRRAIQSAWLVALGYTLGGIGPILLASFGTHLNPMLFAASVLGLMGLSAWIKAWYTQTSIPERIARQLGIAILCLGFAWVLGRFLLVELLAGG